MALATYLKTGFRAGVVALALGGGAIATTAPAQAAALNFQLNFGGPGFGPGFGPGPGVVLRFGSPNYFKYCMDNSDIAEALRDNGYRKIQIVREMNASNKVWVVAQKKSSWYQLRVDRCTGKVDKVTKLKTNQYDNNGHFNLTFNF